MSIAENIFTHFFTQNIKKFYCSKSTVEKLFRFTTNMSIRDYLVRRRMSRAAKDIREGASFLDLALKYGYSSHEAFTRAFKSVWHVTPSEYKHNPAKCELFPALRLEPSLMEDKKMKDRKKWISVNYTIISRKDGIVIL